MTTPPAGRTRTPRLAAIDCGTNTIRLLIAESRGDELIELDRRMITVRLGEGVDRTGVLSEAALARTWAACSEYAEAIAAADVADVRFVATSASRDASNFDEFADGVRGRVGVNPEVISGFDEALLSFKGATAGAMFPAPTLVFDIGGGSTEFVLGGPVPQFWTSVDIGCVRLTERVAAGDPMSRSDLVRLAQLIDENLDSAAEAVPLADAASVVGLAGTVTTVAALALGLPEYDPHRIHRARISKADVDRVVDDLVGMSIAERDALPVMQPGRADVIVAGGLILKSVLDRCATDVLDVSESDILHGIIWSLVDGAVG